MRAGDNPEQPEDAHAEQVDRVDAVARVDQPGEVPDAQSAAGTPAGESYDWYIRGLDLLQKGNAAAAVQILGYAATAEPHSRSAREALARAQFDAGLYPEARENFAVIVEVDPADDYAQFGMGLAAARTGDFRTAVEHLSLAAAMRPDLSHYHRALRGARAALRS